MHIHGSIPTVQGGNFYGISNGEQAIAARRAAAMRKRLLGAGEDSQENVSDEERALIGQWMDARHSQVATGDSDHAGEAGRDPEFG